MSVSMVDYKRREGVGGGQSKSLGGQKHIHKAPLDKKNNKNKVSYKEVLMKANNQKEGGIGVPSVKNLIQSGNPK